MSSTTVEKPRGLRLLQMGPIPLVWALLILSGVVLLVGGGIAGSSAGYFINPSSQTSPSCDRILVRNIVLSGSIAAQAGVLLLVLGFFGAAATSPDLDRGVRAALFVGGVIILVFVPSFFGLRFSTGSFYC